MNSLKVSRHIVGMLLIVLLAGCGSALPSGGMPIIDWVDFIQFDGIQYLATETPQERPALEQDDLGPQFATVQFTVSDNAGPGYRLKDGDAAFLPAGTPVYTVQGYAPMFRLAAVQRGRIVLYEADTNPHAARGADLLDISGKVRSIGINSPEDGRELAVIADPHHVAAVVDIIMQAPVRQPQDAEPPVLNDVRGCFITFHLEDGTSVRRNLYYNRDAGEVQRGIMLPRAFASAWEQAVASANTTAC